MKTMSGTGVMVIAMQQAMIGVLAVAWMATTWGSTSMGSPSMGSTSINNPSMTSTSMKGCYIVAAAAMSDGFAYQSSRGRLRRTGATCLHDLKTA